MNMKLPAAGLLIIASLVSVAFAQAPAHKMVMANDLKWDD